MPRWAQYFLASRKRGTTDGGPQREWTPAIAHFSPAQRNFLRVPRWGPWVPIMDPRSCRRSRLCPSWGRRPCPRSGSTSRVSRQRAPDYWLLELGAPLVVDVDAGIDDKSWLGQTWRRW